jgi:hypothetical protein
MYRVFQVDAALAGVDANGKRHFTEYRESKSDASGNLVWLEWGEGANNWLRNQIYWTGTEWFDCPTNFVHEGTPWNARGESESLYCKSFSSKAKRSARDVAGLKLIDLVKEIRAYPLADTAGKFSAWGPDPSDATVIAALGTKTFPADSKLFYQTDTQLVNPDVYGTTAGDVAQVGSADLANGVAAACAANTPATAASMQSQAATLEAVIERAPGLPCVNPANASTGPTNEGWGSTTVSIGNITTSTPFEVPGTVYKNNVKRIRAAFGADKAVTYYSCLARISDNSARNCTAIGTGTYSIDVQGDARVLRLAGAPAAAASFAYNRIFVERAGKVYYGQRDKLAVSNSLRLNLPAADALGSALGI